MDFVEFFCPVSEREQANLYVLTSTHVVFIVEYQRSETNVVLIVSNGVLYEVHATRRRKKPKQKNNTICVGRQYTRAHTNNVNKPSCKHLAEKTKRT
jgi:hypothetical protein